MRSDILDLHHFYEKPLGQLACHFIGHHLTELWGDCHGLRVAGFGFSTPYLPLFQEARSSLAFAPDAQGVMRWPYPGADKPGETPDPSGGNRACLVHEGFWPLADRSIDRILIVHGLEEVRDASRLLREAWRVLADDGKIILVAAQRRGLWATLDTSPMAAGRPWLRGQLSRLLARSFFTPTDWRRALNFLPFSNRLLLKSAPTMEIVGRVVWPGFCGVLIVEAEKSLMHPVTGTPQRVLNVIRPKLKGGLLPAGRPGVALPATPAPCQGPILPCARQTTLLEP